MVIFKFLSIFSVSINLIFSFEESQIEELKILRIGYVDQTSILSESQLENFRIYLEAQPEFMQELNNHGFNSIGLFPCDGSEDMGRRLKSREFHLAFSPAKLFPEVSEDYTTLLQERRPGDFMPAGGGRVTRQGVVIVSTRSPLFSLDFNSESANQIIRQQIKEGPLAVVSIQDIAGYYAPLLDLRRKYEISSVPEKGYLWFQNSEEVVKAVISGLADMGACEYGAIRRVLEESDIQNRQDELLRILLLTPPFPTNPVIIRQDLQPRISPLGRELKNQLRSYAREGNFGDLRYEPSEDINYQVLQGLIEVFLDWEGTRETSP